MKTLITYLNRKAAKVLLGFIFLMFGLFTREARATHVVGADLTYTCINHPDSIGWIRVRIAVFRDCGGIPLCENGCTSCQLVVAIAGADPGCDGTPLGGLTCNIVSVQDVNPFPECPGSKNICTNAGCVAPGTFNMPAIERYDFEGVINLRSMPIPSTCCNVKFYYEIAARNGVISNILAAGNTWFYSEAIINRCLSMNPCNSSPVISNDPYAVVCGGQPYVFNNGLIDILTLYLTSLPGH